MMSRDSNFGSDSFRKGGARPYSDTRSRFDDRSGSNDYGNDSRSYQPQPSSNPPGNFGNTGSYNSRENTGPRYMSNARGSRYNADSGSSRYGGGGGGGGGDGGGSQYESGSNYSNSGPPNFNSGPPNYNSDGPQGYNNSSGPGNYGSGGPNFGGSGPPRPQGPMGGPPAPRNAGYGSVPTENLFSSIQTLSEISKNDFASKILSAVLQTSYLGNQQQGGPPFNDDQMSGYSDRKKYSSRSSRPGGGRPPPPRHSGPSGGPSRFSRERLRNLRISFPANRSKYDRAFPVKSRSSLSRKRSLSRSTPPRDTSKSNKRRRSSSRERKESPRRKEDNDSPDRKERGSQEKEKENDEEDSKKDDIPLAALYCHMCKHGNFTSVKTYLYHLDGVKHRKTAMAFHARNEATLEYLRKNAKLANVRFGGKESGVSTSKCTVCTAIIKESFSKHRKLLEHKTVKKFMSPACCGRYFKTRYDMNEHRLSLPHLRKIYEANEEKKIFLEDVKAKPGKWNHDDIVKQLMSHNPVPEGHLTLENLPPFDGNTFIGIKFLRPKEATYCKPCKTLLPVGIKSLETHMVSLEHYDNVQDYLREKRKRRMEGGIKKEKGEGEEGDSDSDDSDDEKNADGTADSSRFSRTREREDDDDEDDEEEEGAVVMVKGSDDEDEKDEDEKDDMPFFDETSHIVLEEIGEDMPNKQEANEEENNEEEGEQEEVKQEEEEEEQEQGQEEQYEEVDEGQEEGNEDEEAQDPNEYIPE